MPNTVPELRTAQPQLERLAVSLRSDTLVAISWAGLARGSVVEREAGFGAFAFFRTGLRWTLNSGTWPRPKPVQLCSTRHLL